MRGDPHRLADRLDRAVLADKCAHANFGAGERIIDPVDAESDDLECRAHVEQLSRLARGAPARGIEYDDVDRLAAHGLERLAHIDRADDAELAGSRQRVLDTLTK
ncbi:MAG TPA: hypothetical protein VFD53_09815 [Ilumatobacter sp.]|nr:hypothetical protein [Ilumatobacter sp.]